MDPLTALLGLIPPPWNAVAVFGLGILTKWLHGRISPAPTPAPTPAPAPGPAPSPTPLKDWFLSWLGQRLTARGAEAPPPADLTPAQLADLMKLYGDRIAG